MKQFFGQCIGVLLFLAAIAVFGLAVMFLWNILLPGIFGLPVINYWQAAGLLMLTRLLFGGMSGAPIRRHNNPFRDRWFGMSEKDREAFLARHRAGFPPTDGERPAFNEGDRRNRPPYQHGAEKN